VTAYFVVAEALTNAIKHAGAARVQVRARVDDDRLRLEVWDDGRGGADPDGSGLTGIRDRVSALGGTVRIISDAGAGTRLEVELPCGSS
jgi:signal transduction histidine kinase